MANRSTIRFREFYEDESTRYHQRRYQTRYGRVFKALHHEQIRELLSRTPDGASILEIACGTGHVSELLAELGHEFVACDLTRPMLEQARERTTDKQGEAQFVLTDAYRLPFADDSFDLIVSTRFLHLFPPEGQQPLLSEIRRVLRSGGYLIVDFDNRVSRWVYAFPYLIYNLIRYRRVAAYSHYNTVRQVRRMFSESGLEATEVFGVGGTLLVVPALASTAAAVRLGRLHRSMPLRWLAEQLLVFGTKP